MSGGFAALGAVATPMPAWIRTAAAIALQLVVAVSPPASLAAPFEDTIAQRMLACTGCHGAQGRAAADGYYPRIAGKPAGYLYNQLLNFRDGRRDYAPMTHLLAPLTDAYLQEIAGHFAGLDLAYPPPAATRIDTALAARAERLVRQGEPARGVPACTACHGASMTGVAPFVPGLLGLPRDYLGAQLGAWRAGKRAAQPPDCMAEVARALSLEDIAAITGWLASRPVPANAKPEAGFVAPPPLRCGGVVAGVGGATPAGAVPR